MTDRNLRPLFRLIALVLVTVAIASFMHYSDAKSLARIDSMSPEAFVAYERHLHGHSDLFHYIAIFVGGGLFLGSIEMIVYLFSLCVPFRKPSA